MLWLPGSTAITRRAGERGIRNRNGSLDTDATLFLFLVFVDDKFPGLREDRRRDKDQQKPRPVDLRAPPEQRAEDRNVAEDGNRFDKGRLLTLQDAAHDDGLAGFDNDARGQLLRAGFGQLDIERADDVARSVRVAQRGEGDQLDVLADPRIQRQQNAFAVAADAGEDVEFNARSQYVR